MEHHDNADTGLLDEFAAFMASAGDPYPADTRSNVAVFVDWHRTHSARDVTTVDEDDIVEFLFGWVAARAQPMSDEESSVFCRSVGAFFEFLGDAGRLDGGHDRGVGLNQLTVSLASPLHKMMTNPGFDPRSALYHPGFNPPGKPRYIELLAQPDQMPNDKLETELLARMAEYEALPADDRAAAMDRDLDEEPEPVELPFVYVPPPAAEVESAAAAAPLLGKIEALRGYLGEAGKPLTERGNIKRADGKALVELLDTGDEMDPQIGDRTFRTSTTQELPGLSSIVNIAKKAGAVRIHQRHLVPVKSWARKSATDRATAVYDAIVRLGPLGSRDPAYEIFARVAELLDSWVVHWLARILHPGGVGNVDELVELIGPVLRGEIESDWPMWSDNIETMARYDVSHIFQTLETAGVVKWTHWREEISALRSYPTGGLIRLTALGRHMVPIHLEEAGYLLRSADEIADSSAEALLDVLDEVADEQRQSVVDAWRPTADVAERVQAIVDVVGSADDPALRLKGFAALELFDSAVVGPALRALLDGPAAGHAALYLMSRGLADEAEVGDLIDIGVFVDVLAGSLDRPDELCEMFSEAPHAADQYAALEQMWRHPAAHTAAVLDALGRHHPDRKIAKAARKSAMRHRSWMADRG
ncbi:hypothetical protein [Mycolicibacterium sp. XJ870]